MAQDLLHAAAVASVCFVGDSAHFISGSADKSAKHVDCSTTPWTTLVTLRGHKDKVTACAANPSLPHLVVTASRDHTLKLWNVVTSKLVATFREHSEPVTDVSFSPDGTKIVSASLDCRLIVWNLEDPNPLLVLQSHAAGVGACAYAPKGALRLIVSGDDDGLVNMWHSSTGKLLKSLPGHKQQVTQLRFLPTGELFFSASGDMSVICWDSYTGDVMRTLYGHTEAIFGLSVSPCGFHLASASAAGELFVWNTDEGSIIKRYSDSHPLTGCAFSPDNSKIVVGSMSGSVLIFPHLADASLKTTPRAGITRPFQNCEPEAANGSSPVSAASSPPGSPKISRLSPDKSSRSGRSPAGSPLLRRVTQNTMSSSSQPGSPGTSPPKIPMSPDAQLTRERLRNDQLQAELVRSSTELEAARAEISDLRTEVKSVSRSRAGSNASEYTPAPLKKHWQIDLKQLTGQKSLLSNPSNVMSSCLWQGAPVCLKKFREPIRSPASFKIWEEVAALRCTLGHPNLLHFYGAALSVGEPASFVVEAVSASWGELAIAELRLTLREALDMATGLARGIAYLHERGVSHSRITVYNVFCQRDLWTKLGGAYEADAVYKTFTNPPSGDKYYMAPEQQSGGQDIDFYKADCYTFAVVVTDLLLGLSNSSSAHLKRIGDIPFQALQRTCLTCAQPAAADRMDMKDILAALESLRGSGMYEAYEECAPRRSIARTARGDISLV